MAIAMTPNGKTAYVVAGVQGGKPYDNSVIPIDLATDRALAPIRLKASGLASGVVISPDGQTAYVLSPRAVTPINTATNEAGSAIKLPDADGLAYDIAQTPNGKRIYLVSPRGVIPIKLASRTVLPMISIPDVWTFGLFAITPDGRTVFVETNAGLLPISTRTNAGGKVIKLLRPSTVTFGG
jgi:DNA-binding beta-propeller fold protein YncE